ncbi:hypothetical protein B0H14DRAFT_2580055 [Mycena olivaceomarginata]|nr:hypothetical protein B0H14DRAFT_2580055 [Mycena olivaceomarginata]
MPFTSNRMFQVQRKCQDSQGPRSRYCHQTIFWLTQAIVKGTQCMVNVTLCARVALMVIFQQIFSLVNGLKVVIAQGLSQVPGRRLLGQTRQASRKIRREADGDAKKIIKVFHKLLDEDQEKHVKTDDHIDKTPVDEFQQVVDDLIDIAAINTATLVQGGSM